MSRIAAPATAAAPHAAAPHTATPTSLIDEVMDTLLRGEDARFADLARATWSSQATLAALTGSLTPSRAIAPPAAALLASTARDAA